MPNAKGRIAGGIRRRSGKKYAAQPLTIVTPATVLNVPEDVAIASITFTAVNNRGPVTWSSTTLPPGMSFSAGGVLSGTPTTPGTTDVTFTASDSFSTDTADFSITVTAVGGLTILTPTAIPDLVVGQAMDPITFTASGGTTPYAWAAASVPNGVTFTDNGDNTATLAGTPTTINTTGANRKFTVTDNVAATASVTFRVKQVAAPAFAAWPQQIQGKRGLTINGTLAMRDAFYTALTGVQGPPATLGKAKWQYAKILAQWNSLEANGNHVYDWSSVKAVSEWCQDRGIRPIYNLTFTPWKYTIKPTATIAKFVAPDRVYFTAGSLTEGDWRGMHLKDAGGKIKDGTIVHPTDKGGTDGGQRYLVIVGTTLTNSTPSGASAVCTFGGYTGSGFAQADVTLAVADAYLPDLARVSVMLMSQPWAKGGMIFRGNEVNASGFMAPGMGVNGYPQRYCAELAYMTRALKEFDPSIIVSSSGVANQPPPSGFWNFTPEDFLIGMWRTFKDTSKGAGKLWHDWADETTGLLPSSLLLTNHTMAELHAANVVDDDFPLEMVGYDSYLQGRKSTPAPSTGADNWKRWDNTNAAATSPVRLVQFGNDMHKEDPVTIEITGAPGSGTFKIGVNIYAQSSTDYNIGNGVTVTIYSDTPGTVVATATIPYNPTDSQIQTAINAKMSTGSCRVVTLVAGKKFKVYFEGAAFIPTGTSPKLGFDKPSRNCELTLHTNSLGGGSSPTVTMKRLGLERMNFLFPECGMGWHPLSITGKGDPVYGTEIGSEEEAYISFASMFRTMALDLAYPTGGAFPPILGGWDPRKRMGIMNIQWLMENSGKYGTDYFSANGMTIWPGNTKYPTGNSRPGWPGGTLKRAVVPNSRPYLNGTGGKVGATATWGSETNGADAVDAWNRTFPV